MRADSIGPILAPIVTALVMSALLRGAWRSVPPAPDGSLRLTYGRGVTALGVFVLLFVAFLACFAVVSPPRNRGDVTALVGLVVGFGVPGAYLVATGRRASLQVTKHGVIATGTWRPARAVAWEDVARVHFSRGLGYLVLTGRDGRKVRVSPLLTGFLPFLDLLVERLGADLAGQAAREAREYTARLGRMGAPAPPPRR